MRRQWKVVFWSLAGLLAACALALFLWWLPARSPSGYYVARTRGAADQMPYAAAIWVRPWPWDTQPPAADVTLSVAGEAPISSTGSAAPVSFFAPRAVPVLLSLSGQGTGFAQSGRIEEISLAWSGGSTSRREHHLFAVRATLDSALTGFAPLVTTPGPQFGWAFAVLLRKVPQRVLAVSSPNPLAGPWQTPRCRSLRSADAAGNGSTREIQRFVASMTAAACQNMRGPEAAVLTARPPDAPVFYIYEGILRVENGGKVETIASGASQIAAVVPPSAYNWWQFVQ